MVSTLFLAAVSSISMAQKTFDVNVTNKSKNDRKATPVVLQLKQYGVDVKSAVVTKKTEPKCPANLMISTTTAYTTNCVS